MNGKHRAWALFFAALFAGIAFFIGHVVSLRPNENDRGAVVALIVVVLLVAARFAWAAVTGRIPRWMEELFDNPD